MKRLVDFDERDALLGATFYLLLFVLLSRGLAIFGGALLGAGWYWLAPLAYLVPLALALVWSRGALLRFGKRPCARGMADTLPLLPLFLAAVMALSHLSALVLDALHLPVSGGGATGAGFVPDLLFNCLLPAVLEELFFRGLILSLLLRRFGSGAIFLSALCFALAHGSLYQLPYAFVGGVFLALSAVVGRSVFYPMLFHLLNNLISLALQYTQTAWEHILPPYVLVYIFVAIFSVVAVVYLLFCKDCAARGEIKALFASPKESAREVLRGAFASPLTCFLLPMLILTVGRVFL